MGRYTDLARSLREQRAPDMEEGSTDDILNVNINNIHTNRENGVGTPIPPRPESTLQGSSSVKMPQGGASGDKDASRETDKLATNLRTTNLTNLMKPAVGVRCIHGKAGEGCAVCNGYARWLIAGGAGRIEKARRNPEAVRREFWRAVIGARA